MVKHSLLIQSAQLNHIALTRAFTKVEYLPRVCFLPKSKTKFPDIRPLGLPLP